MEISAIRPGPELRAMLLVKCLTHAEACVVRAEEEVLRCEEAIEHHKARVRRLRVALEAMGVRETKEGFFHGC